jgi:Tfp pilus assembly protein PilZ
MSSKDKRRYPRVNAKNVSAHLNVADQSSPCQIQDISAGGIFIETSEALPVGMPVSVNLARPGWSKVLRLSGRVVWALAARTAAKKGVPPGMRIRFDALAQTNAADLMKLLSDLGAVDSPEPLTVADGAASKPVSLRQIKARVSKLDLPPGPSDDTSPSMGPYAPTVPSPTVRPVGTAATIGAPIAKPSGGGATTSDNPRHLIQVQGLMMQNAELKGLLELRDKELTALRERLKVKEEALDKSDRERKAAELAIQRLAMQLSSRR